ncbi:MAG: glycosyl hydrolase family 28 protein [Dysgonomonas sp.]
MNYKHNKIIALLLIILGFVNVQISAADVRAYNLPSCYTSSANFSLSVSGTAVPVSKTFGIYEYAHYSFSGETTITITASEAITTYKISPLAYNIEGTVSGNTLTFNLSQSRYLIVKINNLPDLIIAADDLETDVPNSSGTGIYNIVTDYQADPSGNTLCTTAIQHAIDDANAANGGIVYVPQGVYTSAQLVLKSNVSIYLEAGAVIRGTSDASIYTVKYNKTSQGQGFWFIYTAENADNIKIYGRGTLDANGHALRKDSKLFNAILMPMQCSNFHVNGIIFRDSGLWGVTLTRSNDLSFLNTKHFNENNDDHENDAVDVQECQNVLFKHSIAVSEDDTYSTKTWESTTDLALSWYGSPEDLENVVFDDCVAWSRCATFKVGYGVCQKQNNITFKNSTSYSSMRAIAVNHKYCPMPATNITFDNIDVENFWPRSGSNSRWFEMDMAKEGGVVSDVTVKNINVRKLGNQPSVLKGFSATSPLKNITFENIYMLGSTAPATSLAEMNITSTNEYIENLKIIPAEIGNAVEINHSTTGSLSTEIITTLNGVDPAGIKFVSIVGTAGLSFSDCRAIIAAFPNLVGLDLYKAIFSDNAIPDAENGVGAFENLHASSVRLPAGILKIGTQAFKGGSNITSIMVYSASVAAAAFADCPAMTTAYYTSETLPVNTSSDAFAQGITLFVPYGKQSAYSGALSAATIDDGTVGNEYKIATPCDLDAVRLYHSQKTANFQLTADIDVANWISNNANADVRQKGWLPLGDSQSKISGVFDGQGYFVYNLWIKRTTTTDVGLFGYLSNAKIQKLGVKILDGNTITGANEVAGIAGAAETTQFEQCCVNGNISGNKQVAGILGTAYSESIAMKQCYFSGKITGTDACGGLWGLVSQKNSFLEESYSSGSIDGGVGTAGGVIAVMYNTSETIPYITVKNSGSAMSSVDGAWGAGRVGGYEKRDNIATYDNNFAYNRMTVNGSAVRTGTAINKDGLGKTPTELVDAATYSAWNFADVWKMGNEKYPLPVLKNLTLAFQPTVNPSFLPENSSILADNISGILIYPNPTSGKLFIDGKADNTKAYVFDYLGRLLYETQNTELDITSYANGVYLIKVQDRIVKIIKK